MTFDFWKVLKGSKALKASNCLSNACYNLLRFSPLTYIFSITNLFNSPYLTTAPHPFHPSPFFLPSIQNIYLSPSFQIFFWQASEFPWPRGIKSTCQLEFQAKICLPPALSRLIHPRTLWWFPFSPATNLE